MVTGNFAFADIVTNTLTSTAEGKVLTVEAGSSGTVGYSVQNTNSNNSTDPQNNCNPSDGSALSVSPTNLPAGVSATPSPLSIAGCGTVLTIAFAVDEDVELDDYAIGHSLTDNGTGTYTDSAGFILRVTAPAKESQTITFGQPTTPAQYGDSFTVAPTASSELAVSLAATGACSASGYTVTMNASTGDCTLTASQAGNDAYNAATNVIRTVGAIKREASVTPHAKGKTFGADDPDLTGTLSGFLASDNVVATYSRTPGEDAGGNYTISADLDPDAALGNYDIDYNTAAFTIGKADTTTTVTCTAGPFTYTGSAQTPCSATVTGPGGLNQNLAVDYTDNINAGQATATASYAATSNYNGDTDSKNFTIGKADATVDVTCTAGPFTYTGSAQTPCSATVTGPGNFSQTLTPTYQDNINAGTATASASFAGNDNLLSDTGSDTFTIDKAPTTTTVTCNSTPVPTYNGSAHEPCGASVTGPGLDQALTVAYTANINAGQATASASYAGNDNLLGSNDSKTFSISPATTSTVVTCQAGPFIFTGSEIRPCSATVTGPAGLSSSVVVTYSNNTNPGQATASATYAGTNNYLTSTDSKNFTINSWTLKGFYAPVDKNIVNVAKAGSTVPLKFEVFAGLTELDNTSIVESFVARKYNCETLEGLGMDLIENYTSGATSLRHDGSQFIQNWQTPKSGAGICFEVTVTTDDGSTAVALFKLK